MCCPGRLSDDCDFVFFFVVVVSAFVFFLARHRRRRRRRRRRLDARAAPPAAPAASASRTRGPSTEGAAELWARLSRRCGCLEASSGVWRWRWRERKRRRKRHSFLTIFSFIFFLSRFRLFYESVATIVFCNCTCHSKKKKRTIFFYFQNSNEENHYNDEDQGRRKKKNSSLCFSLAFFSPSTFATSLSTLPSCSRFGLNTEAEEYLNCRMKEENVFFFFFQIERKHSAFTARRGRVFFFFFS